MSGEESEADNFLFAGWLSARKISNYMQEYVLYYEFYTVGTLFRKGRNYFRKGKGHYLYKCGTIMIHFTADLHFYHDKIIRHTQRPFYNVEEMNKALIRNWNKKVSYDDEVYILGDFTMKGADIASACLCSLQGKKYLIRGNHDRFVDSPEFECSLFVSIRDYMEITYLNTCFVLFHYPMVEWNGGRKGAIALHGHQHNHRSYNLENRKKGILRYDVGVDANDMTPISAKEIIDFFN